MSILTRVPDSLRQNRKIKAHCVIPPAGVTLAQIAPTAFIVGHPVPRSALCFMPIFLQNKQAKETQKRSLSMTRAINLYSLSRIHEEAPFNALDKHMRSEERR